MWFSLQYIAVILRPVRQPSNLFTAEICYTCNSLYTTNRMYQFPPAMYCLEYEWCFSHLVPSGLQYTAKADDDRQYSNAKLMSVWYIIEFCRNYQDLLSIRSSSKMVDELCDVAEEIRSSSKKVDHLGDMAESTRTVLS